MSLGMGARAASQAAVFIIVARILGVEAYGAYAAALAIAASIGALTGVGVPMVLVRRVAQDPSSFPRMWRSAVSVVFASGATLLIVYLALAWSVLPPKISWLVVVLLGIVEILLTPLALLASYAFQGHDRIGAAARTVLIPSLLRLAVAILLAPVASAFAGFDPLEVWAVLYAAAGFSGAVYAHLSVRRRLGSGADAPAAESRGAIREGLSFAGGGVALRLHSDVDKIMLARMATLEATGAYSAGHRVVELALVPLNAFMAAWRPRLFRLASSGPDVGLKQYKAIFWPLVTYAAVAWLALNLLASWLPIILGSDFQTAVSVVKWLALLPLATLPRLMLQNILAALHRQKAAMFIQFAGAGVNVLLNLWLIPVWSWRGAVAATYIAELAMIILMWRAARTRPRGT